MGRRRDVSESRVADVADRYAFRYETGELHLYQSEASDEEKEASAGPYPAVLSSSDWAVLKLCWVEYLKQGSR